MNLGNNKKQFYQYISVGLSMRVKDFCPEHQHSVCLLHDAVAGYSSEAHLLPQRQHYHPYSGSILTGLQQDRPETGPHWQEYLKHSQNKLFSPNLA